MSKIIGVGTDIVEVGRVLKSCEKHSFLNKYYTEAERELVKRRKITIVKRMRKYLELVSEDESLITSVIPMGDGIAVTKRR